MNIKTNSKKQDEILATSPINKNASLEEIGISDEEMVSGNESSVPSAMVESLFELGAHIGYSKTRRHPSVLRNLFGTKNRIDIIDLTQTEKQIKKAIEIVGAVKEKGGKVLFVGTKPEAKDIVRQTAAGMNMPYVTERWVGGTLTNYPEIKKRITLMLDLIQKNAENSLIYKTKKEKLLILRKLEKLERTFSGLRWIDGMPNLIVVVDPKKEHIAMGEAIAKHIPIIAVANTDCDVSEATHTIVANDASYGTIEYILNRIASPLRIGN